jgi:hypothetical protein
MRVAHEAMEEIRVVRNPESVTVELQIGHAAGEDPLAVRLTPEEARQLAALLLFQSNRHPEQESRRRS